MELYSQTGAMPEHPADDMQDHPIAAQKTEPRGRRQRQSIRIGRSALEGTERLSFRCKYETAEPQSDGIRSALETVKRLSDEDERIRRHSSRFAGSVQPNNC
jgi:hypothetical protein